MALYKAKSDETKNHTQNGCPHRSKYNTCEVSSYYNGVYYLQVQRTQGAHRSCWSNKGSAGQILLIALPKTMASSKRYGEAKTGPMPWQGCPNCEVLDWSGMFWWTLFDDQLNIVTGW